MALCAQIMNNNFLSISENLLASDKDVQPSKISLQTTGFEDYTYQEEALSSKSPLFNHYEYPLNSDVEEPIQGVLNFSELGNDARLIVPNNAKRKELLTDPQSSLRIVGVNSRSSNLPTSMTLRSKDYQSKTSYKTSLFHENSTSTTSSGGASRAVIKRGNDEDYSAKPLRLAASTE